MSGLRPTEITIRDLLQKELRQGYLVKRCARCHLELERRKGKFRLTGQLRLMITC